MRNYPRITIITSTFNCANALRKTSRSIRDQTYENIQWIIVDGASTDGTIEVIKENIDIVSEWLSEPDNGIYDAWNKACNLINGDWIIFLGAGDTIFNKNGLNDISRHCRDINESVVIIYGNVLFTKPNGIVRYISRTPTLDHFEYGRPALPHHQGVFHKSNLFNGNQSFDSTYKIAGDSKFLLSARKIGEFSHADFVICTMTDDGTSNNYKNIYATHREIHRICKELSIKIPLAHKISSYLVRVLHYTANRFFPTSFKKNIQAFLDKTRFTK